jgi:hypothetical protein
MTVTLSSLQEWYLELISFESLQLKLHFNMTKLWHTHFFNLCLQVVYLMHESGLWLWNNSKERQVKQKIIFPKLIVNACWDYVLILEKQANLGVFIGEMAANMQPLPSVSWPLQQAHLFKNVTISCGIYHSIHKWLQMSTTIIHLCKTGGARPLTHTS